MTDRDDLIAELDNKLDEEHVGICHDNTCDINAASRIGATFWAAEMFVSSGASSPDFDGLFFSVNPTREELEVERLRLLEEPHGDCAWCKSIIWEEVKIGTWCNNCGKPQPYEWFWGPEQPGDH